MGIFSLENWLDKFKTKILENFKNRILFIGLQGSYNRGEATKNSDIDVIIILDKLTINDLKQYKKIIKLMPYSKKACGFISGKREIENWSKSDIFQFVYDTKSLYGNLKNIVSAPTKSDIKTSIKISCENLYHATCHSYLYDENMKASLVQLYKMTFFILQSEYFLKTNEYIPTKLQLLEKLTGSDKCVLQTCINREKFLELNEVEIQNLYDRLLQWCAKRIASSD